MMLKDHKQLPVYHKPKVFGSLLINMYNTYVHVYVMIVIPLQLLHIHNYVSYILRSKLRPKHLCHKKKLDLCHFNKDFYYIFLSLLQLYQCILLYTRKPFLFLLQEPLKNFCTVSETN